MSSNSIDNMNNLERWIYGVPPSDLTSYEDLKREIYGHAKRDYVFFPFLVGYAKRYIKENGVNEIVRNCVYQLLYDLLTENKVVVLFVNSTSLKVAHWNSVDDVKQIIERIKVEWDTLDGKEPEVNELIWLTTLNDLELKDKNGEVRIKLSDFKKQYGDDEPVFIDLLVEITMDNAIAKEVITIELSDFDEFVNNLKRLNETLKQTFYFQYVDEQLQIKFELLITGNISVTGFLKDKQYVNTLNFSFEMPPIELAHLLRQSENIIDILM